MIPSRIVVARILKMIGLTGLSLEIIDVLSDVFENYMALICKNCILVSENAGRTCAGLSDLCAVFCILNISPLSLKQLPMIQVKMPKLPAITNSRFTLKSTNNDFHGFPLVIHGTLIKQYEEKSQPLFVVPSCYSKSQISDKQKKS